MDWGVSAAGVWLILALVLGIAELAAPGVFLVFLGIAATITGLAALALPDLPTAAQLATFGVWSVVAVVIGRRWYRDYAVPAADPLLNDRAARLVGRIVTVEQPIVGGHGRVLIGDGGWPASGPDAAAGERLRITGVRDGTVMVEPLPPA